MRPRHVAAAALVLACESSAPEPTSSPAPAASGMSAAQRAALQARARPSPSPAPAAPAPAAAPKKISAKPVAKVPVSPDDPAKGSFTLAQATAGIAGGGKLVATIQTGKGNLDCELFEDKAPITVANFVGLARGLRPWKHPDGKWVKTPAYDGTGFHRVIPGFMIQGGDPAGTGAGEPGYVIPDEIWEDARHDTPGQLCMANRGPNTNGAQFFITDGAPAHLDGGYTIFGHCTPQSVVKAIAESPRSGDRATDPVKIQKITVARRK